jgi:hypothetical protein
MQKREHGVIAPRNHVSNTDYTKMHTLYMCAAIPHSEMSVRVLAYYSLLRRETKSWITVAEREMDE